MLDENDFEDILKETSVIEDYSGKFLLRIPKSLHLELVEAAKHENISLNQYVLFKLSRPTPKDYGIFKITRYGDIDSMIINQTLFFDTIVMDEHWEIDYIILKSKQILKNGGKVMIEKTWSNAPSETRAVFSNNTELSKFVEKVEEFKQYVQNINQKSRP
jgi:hypothetical protein